MKIYKHNNETIQVGIPFEIDGVAYPWNWFDLASDKDLADRGFTVEEFPDPKRTSVKSEEIMSQFNTNDAEAIKVAIENNTDFWLLWSALQIQSGPMNTSAERFVQGWGALIQVLGQDRMDEIKAALDIEVG